LGTVYIFAIKKWDSYMHMGAERDVILLQRDGELKKLRMRNCRYCTSVCSSHKLN